MDETDLVVLIDDNGVFTDRSEDAKEFLRDSFSHSFVAAQDSIYIGLYKPFRNTYWELTTPLVGNSITTEYYNGSTWTQLKTSDQTKALSRSGFISWAAPSDWSSTSINSLALYWVRIKIGLNASLGIMGVNLVFANDIDLSKHQRDINKFLAKGDTSFIAYHVAARDEIVQKIRNSGTAKQKSTEAKLRDFTKWDILDISQIKEAATHLALSMINFDVSEGTEADKYYQRYEDHKEMFGSSFKLFFRTFDLNDDGIEDAKKETMRVRSSTFLKL